MSTELLGTFKAIFIIANRKNIMKLIDFCCNENWLKTSNDKENEISKKWKEHYKKIVIIYIIPMSVSIYGYIVIPITLNYDKGELILPSWRLCDIKNKYCFWFNYFHQAIGAWFMEHQHALVDCFLFALIHNIQLQYQLLGYRFENLSKFIVKKKYNSKWNLRKQNEIAVDCVKHHVDIIS